MADIKKYKITSPWLPTKCALGEAPYWESSTNTVRFVDIVNRKLFFCPLTGGASDLKEHQLDYSIGTTADIEGNPDEIVFGGKLGYGIFTRKTGEIRWIAKFWNDAERQDDGGGKPGVGKSREERCRANDGAVDAKGRFFVGVMNDPVVVGGGNFTDEGCLFRLDSDLSIHRIKEQVTIPNGLSWSLSNDKVYYTDSPSGKITLHDFDLSTGAVEFSKTETFFQVPYEGGVPDGHAQDEEGCFWVACFGTGKVVRVDKSGKVVAEIECPTRCVTCPAFCGTELVITSAAEEEPEKYPWSVAHAGATFKIDVGVKGCPINKFKMDKKA